jgi:hypothetical protein
MALYRSLPEFPDRIAHGLETELRSDEELVAGIPEAGENFFAKYATYYVLTSDQFLEYLKAPWGSSRSDSVAISSISRVEISVSSFNISVTLHGTSYSEQYKFKDGDRTGDAEQFARMIRERAVE